MGEFTIDQAVSILEQAINVGASKGAYSIKESAMIYQALTFAKQYIEPVATETVTPELTKK